MKGQKLKRIIDIIGALVGLILTAPIMVILILLVYLTMGRPVFFKQVRAGKDGKPFIIYKFRSMLDLRDEDGNLLPDEQRITPLGRIMRFFRLDELPELFNILKGEMSIVGPRPTLVEQVILYDDFQRRRLKVKPGLTGWAQINGNTMLSWNDRIFLDVWYIDNWSLMLDFKIIFETIKVVFKGERINNKALLEAKTYASSTYRSS